MSSDKKPRPTDVGQSFVKTYSKALETDPASVAHFFKDESLFTHKESNEAAEIVDRGRENITKRIKSLEINEAVVDFQSMDCQEGYNGGVLIVLTGELKKRGTSKHFAQTFFLAPQEPAGYYIHNYIFRVLKEHPHGEAATTPAAAAQHVHAPAAAASSPSTAAAASAPAQQAYSSPVPAPAATKEHPPKKEGKKERKPAAATTNGTAAADAAATPAAAAAATPAPAATAAAAAPAAPAAAASTAPAPAAGNKKKPSWASVASSASLNPSAAPAASAASPATEKAPSKTAPSKPTQAAAAAASSAAAAAGGAAPVRNNPAAVFVKNLPFEISPEELQTEFSKYGKVKSLSPRKGFAFLEYETVEGAESLLNASQKNPIKMGERVLQIERRTKDSSASKGPRDPKPKGDKPPRATGPKPAGAKPSPKPSPAH